MNLVSLAQSNTVGLIALAAACVILAIIKYLKFRLALKNTTPAQRPAIIEALVPMFKQEWHLGPLRREAGKQSGPGGKTPPVRQRTVDLHRSTGEGT